MINTDRLCPGCMNDNGGEKICSICGYDAATQNEKDCLPVRFLLSERFLIGTAISRNVEGITYLAWDNSSDTAVHIKEYFPSETAVRNPDKTVSVTQGNEFVFNEGLIDFIELNKKFASAKLPSIIPVKTVFEENGTVYAVTQIISGITMQSFLERNGGNLRWEQARPLLLPLIDTIKGLHDLGIVHGGISPETILVGRDGKLRITGICIPRLRKANSDSSSQLYNGYAAPEQYGKSDYSVGVYSDVYALSATLFRILIGTVPPSAETRLQNDSLTIPAKFADELPRQVLVAIANGLQINVASRTPDIDVFKNELVYGETLENMRKSASRDNARNQASKKEPQKRAKGGNGVKYAAISCGVTAAIFLVIGIVLCFTVFKDSIFGKDDILNNPSEVISMPDVPSIGDVDPDAVESTILYDVPDVKGKYYYELAEDSENAYERFKFTIVDKEYSDKYQRGTICSQSIEPGKQVENETEIQLVISLGPKEVSIANVVGIDELSAKLELLKQGFLYENIEVVEKYDPDSEPGMVLEQSPEYKSNVSTEEIVRIYVNSYKGDVYDSDVDDDASQDTNSNINSRLNNR